MPPGRSSSRETAGPAQRGADRLTGSAPRRDRQTCRHPSGTRSSMPRQFRRGGARSRMSTRPPRTPPSAMTGRAPAARRHPAWRQGWLAACTAGVIAGVKCPGPGSCCRVPAALSCWLEARTARAGCWRCRGAPAPNPTAACRGDSSPESGILPACLGLPVRSVTCARTRGRALDRHRRCLHLHRSPAKDQGSGIAAELQPARQISWSARQNGHPDAARKKTWRTRLGARTGGSACGRQPDRRGGWSLLFGGLERISDSRTSSNFPTGCDVV